MRTILLLSLSLAACTVDGSTDDRVDTSGDLTSLPTQALAKAPSVNVQRAQELCAQTGQHLPTLAQIQNDLHECVATSVGWLCRPSQEDGIGKVWTGEACDGGQYVADFDDGSIVCAKERCLPAHPLCVD